MSEEILQSATRIGYRASEQMHELSYGFIERMEGGATRPEPDTVRRMITGLMNETLDAYMMTPARELGLDPRLQRMVKFTGNAVVKAGGMAISRTTKKMSLEQNIAAAEYMDSLRLLYEEDGMLVTYCAFPMDDRMIALGRTALPLAMEQKLSARNKELTEYLMVLFENAARWYVDEPVRLMKFRPIMGKVVSVASDAIMHAVKSGIREIVPRLSAQEAANYAEYLTTLMIDHPEEDEDAA